MLGATLSPVVNGTTDELVAQANVQMIISRISPNTLYAETMIATLHPEIRSLGIILPAQMEGALQGAPLPFGQSVLLVWPHLTGLIAGTILLFALTYVIFQRQEIRT